MVIAKGELEIGVRGSICASDFMVGAGALDGVRLPWASDGWQLANEKTIATPAINFLVFMILTPLNEINAVSIARRKIVERYIEIHRLSP